MKKVIGKKLYNTEKAEEVFAWENAYYPSDFHYCAETLFRTKKGAWFLYGRGGALSCYRVSSGSNFLTGSQNIMALDENEAYEWLERHANAETIERYFPERIEEA